MQGIKRDLPASIIGHDILGSRGEKIEFKNLHFDDYTNGTSIITVFNGTKIIKIEECIFNSDNLAIDSEFAFSEEFVVKNNT